MKKKEKKYLRDCCRDEIDSARENKKKYKKKGLKTGKFDTWIKKQRELLRGLE